MKATGIGVLVLSVVAALVFLMASLGSWFTVDQGERAVVLRNGKITAVAEPGLEWKMPFIDSVKEISVRDHTFKFDKIEAYSYDQQPATLVVSVTYRVPSDAKSIMELYSEYGTIANLQSRIIERRVLDEVKNVFGRFTAARAIQERQALGIEAIKAVTKSLDEFPVTVAGIQIEEVAFSNVYEQSIEQRMLAQVQIETTQQQKQTSVIDAEIRVIKAKADADSKLEQFKAEAAGIKLRGDAEAAAIMAKAEALKANMNLVQLNAVDRWDGKLPATMVPGSAIPFIGVK